MQEAEPEADEGEWRLGDDDDAVSEWFATGTHEDAAQAFERVWRTGLEMAGDEARFLQAAVAALEAAAATAREPDNRSESDELPESHPTLERLQELLQRSARGQSVAIVALEGTGAGNSWVVHGTLADHTIRELMPLAVPRAESLRALHELGSPYDDEARYTAAGDRLRELAVAAGLPPRRQFAEEDATSLLWWAFEALHLSLFASEGDVGMVPDTAHGWCVYARWLAYEHWTDISEEVYWAGEEIDTRAMALQEPELEEDDMPSMEPQLTSEELAAMRGAWERLERLTFEQRRLTIAGSPREIREHLQEVLPRLDDVAPVLTNTYDPSAIRQIAARRADTIATRCGGGE